MAYNWAYLYMKKILLFIVSILIAVVTFAQSTTKDEIQCLDQNVRMERGTRAASDWGTFTNFVATDMNGDRHDIQHYLDHGKYVVIDFFCAWCGPCWSYHQSGILENLYNTYGPAGTDEFVVLMVECETSNTAAQITGTSTNSSYSGASQGDFTDGGTNPVPIVDATSNLAGRVSLYEGYVPSVYLFCPSGYVYYINNFNSAAAIYNFATASCPNETSLPQVEIIAPDRVSLGRATTISPYVVSVSDVVSYQWSFDDGLPALATTRTADVTWNTIGTKTINVTVTNDYGVATATKEVEVYDCSTATIEEFPFTENFEHGDGCWNFISMNTENTDEYFGVYEYSDGMHGAAFNSYASASSDNYNQYMISPELVHVGTLTLTFKYKKVGNGTEKFSVKYSSTDANPSHFIRIGSVVSNATTSWKTHTCQIPASAKYFMINYSSNYQYYLIIDDLSLTENIPNYTVTATPDDEEHGSVTGSGSYPMYTDVTLEAIPADGYVFEKWSDDDATNPRTFTLTSNVTLTATFAGADTTTTHTLALNVDENCTGMGTVAGAGDYVEGASVQISATPITGYHFTAWNDENTDNPRNVVIDADTSFTASFAINQYAITVNSSNADYGTVAGADTYDYNAVAEISATPAEHCHFLYWNDGNTDNQRSITVTENATFTAYFALDQLTVTVNVDEDSHGIASGSGQYLYNTNAILYAVANQGYTFVQWQDGNTDNPRTIVVTEEVTYTASFREILHYTITVLANDDEYGTVEGSGLYTEGQSIRISATANEGYVFSEWQDGNTDNPRTVVVTENATYTATFVPATVIDGIVASEISIYPNPTTGIVNIDAEGLNKVVVYDVTGRIMMSVANESTIDISNLEAGVYFFSVETENGSAMKKLVKE